MEHIVGGKFKPGRKIGSESFGELYLGITIMAFFMFFFPFLLFVDFSVFVL